MHFRIIQKDEADRYDAFVEAAEFGDILQTFSWGEIKKADWLPVRVVVENETGTILAAMSILIRQLPLFNKNIAYVPRGPILADIHNLDLWAFTLTKLADLAKEHHAIALKIDPDLPDLEHIVQILRENRFQQTGGSHDFGGIQPRYTFRLPLSGTLEEIFSRFTKKMRYKINYGPKHGLVFRENEKTSISDFYTMLTTTGERNDFMVRSQEYFQHLYDVLRSKDQILLLTGYMDNKPVISSLTFAHGKKAWAVYGGQSDAYRDIYTYHALNWERIKWAHSKGAAWFDFYGVPATAGEEHPLHGLYKFKESFGGHFVSFIGEWDLPLSKPYYLLWEKALPRYSFFVHQVIHYKRLHRANHKNT